MGPNVERRAVTGPLGVLVTLVLFAIVLGSLVLSFAGLWLGMALFRR